jgi:hypothetical protein
MDQWIDSADFGHFGKLFLAGVIAGFFGVMLYDLIIARAEAQIGITAMGSV